MAISPGCQERNSVRVKPEVRDPRLARSKQSIRGSKLALPPQKSRFAMPAFETIRKTTESLSSAHRRSLLLHRCGKRYLPYGD